MNAHVLTNAKAYIALVGAIATALLGIYGPETSIGQVLTVIVAVATAVATWTIPNLDPAGRKQDQSVQPPDDERPILGKA